LSSDPRGTVTRLLHEWQHGDEGVADRLMPLIYDELLGLARSYLRSERSDHTLEPAALVHEAFLRLVEQHSVTWQSRAHFFGIAAQMMRRILVDHAREHQSAKRSGSAFRVALDDRIGSSAPFDCEVLLLEEALQELSTLDPRQGQIVEFRYFAGMSEQEVAEVLSVSRSTVTREWQAARAWLYRRMTKTRRRAP